MRRRLSSIPIDSILHSFSKKRSELDDVQRADWAPLLIVIAPFSSGAEDFLDTLREHVELSSPLDLKSPNHFVSVPIETAFSRWNGNLSKEERERMSADVVHKHSLYDRLNPTECTELMLLTQYFSDPKPGGISQFQNRLMNDKNATVEDMYYREQLWQGFTALLSNTKKEDTQMMTNEVKLYIPEAKDHCMSESMNHIKESLKHKEQIIVWNYPPLGGINARWDGYKELMGMAYKYRRVVRFVRWGQELQELPFMQLVQQNIWTFLKTGRYIPLKHLHESMRAAQKLLGVRGTTLTHVECAELAGFTMDGTGRVVPGFSKGAKNVKLSDPQYRWAGWTNDTIVHPLFQNFIAEKAQKRLVRRNTYSEIRREDKLELSGAEAEKVERKLERDYERRASMEAMRMVDDIVRHSQSTDQSSITDFDDDEDYGEIVSENWFNTLPSPSRDRSRSPSPHVLRSVGSTESMSSRRKKTRHFHNFRTRSEEERAGVDDHSISLVSDASQKSSPRGSRSATPTNESPRWLRRYDDETEEELANIDATKAAAFAAAIMEVAETSSPVVDNHDDDDVDRQQQPQYESASETADGTEPLMLPEGCLPSSVMQSSSLTSQQIHNQNSHEVRAPNSAPAIVRSHQAPSQASQDDGMVAEDSASATHHAPRPNTTPAGHMEQPVAVDLAPFDRNNVERNDSNVLDFILCGVFC